MNKRMSIRRWLSVAMFAAAVVVFAVSLVSGNRRSDVESAAQDLGEKIEKRMGLLDKYIDQALHTDKNTWMELKGLPEDMVVYRYVEDSLQSWANQFPIRNLKIKVIDGNDDLIFYLSGKEFLRQVFKYDFHKSPLNI